MVGKHCYIILQPNASLISCCQAPFPKSSCVCFKYHTNLVSHTAKLCQDILIATFGMRRIIEAPVIAIQLTWEVWADLVYLAAHSDHGCNRTIEKSLHMLRCVVADVYADLFKYLNSFGVDEACRVGACAVYVDEIAGNRIEYPLGHMASAGITCAENKNAGFHADQFKQTRNKSIQVNDCDSINDDW